MLNFKVEKLTNVKFSFEELLDYYKEVKDRYKHLECRSPVFPNGYSYAMQTKLSNPNLPCPPFHMPGELGVNNSFDTPTPLMFGFAQKILDNFPYAKQLVITVHGPGAQIEFHTDDELFLPEEHIKIHIPIESNDKSYFQYDRENIVMEPGSVYLVNTTIPHGTDNQGQTERAHMIFKVPVSAVDDILTKEIIL